MLTKATATTNDSHVAVSNPGDRTEREAERVAGEIMRGHSGPGLGARPSRIIAHADGAPQPAEDVAPGGITLPGSRLFAAIVGAARSGGRPLPPSSRIFLEDRLGWPVDDVRVHTDASAGELADRVGARAFTVGRDVFFAPGEYRPDRESGRRLLAHELVHVAQRGGSDVPAVQRQAGPTESRAVAGEQAMGFAYRMEEGWAFLTGPGGGAGHRWNEPGFDGVAFRVAGPFEIHILDNKSLARAGNVSSASALTTNVLKNLDDMIALAGRPQYNSVPRIAQVRARLAAARSAIATGGPLPADVQLRVTNLGGRSTGITQRLRALGVTFDDLMAPGARPATASSTPAPARTTPPAVLPGGTAPTPGTTPTSAGSSAGSSAVSAEARAIAEETGRTLRTDMRLLKAARVLTAALRIVEVIDTLVTVARLLSMAESGLAGKGFVLTKEIAESAKFAIETATLKEDYAAFSDSIQNRGAALFMVRMDPVAAGQTYPELNSLREQIDAAHKGLAERIGRVSAARDEADAKRRAALAILSDPKASAAMVIASFGSEMPQVELFAASEDLLRIEAALRSALDSLRSVDEHMRGDAAFLASWSESLFGVWKKSWAGSGEARGAETAGARPAPPAAP